MPSLSLGNIKGIHYAWIVLACAMVLSAVSAGLRFTFGVFIDPLVEQYGWSRGAISLAYTIAFLSSAPAALLAGRLSDIIGARRLVMISSLTITSGMLLTGTVRELWQLYVYYGVIICGMGTSIFHTLMPVVLTRWFTRRLGLAIGLMWSAVGFGPVLFSPLFRWSIETIGWRPTFSIFGVMAGLIILTASLFLRNRPQDMGMTAYGESALSSGEAHPTTAPTPTPTPTFRVRSTYAFWALVLIHNLGCVSHAIVLAHMVSMAIFKGIPGLAAALMLSIASAVSMGSRFGMSMLAEARGGRATLGLAMLLQTAPIFILLWAESLWAFYLFAVLFGIGYGGEMVGFPIFNRQLFGVNAPLGTIYGYQIAGATLGMALGGWLGGALFDLSDSYTWSAIAAIIAGFAGLVPVLALPRHRRTSEPLLA